MTAMPSPKGDSPDPVHTWSILLGAMAGIRDDGDRIRLAVSALPSLIQCSVSGAALLDAEGSWITLQVERGGEVLGEADLAPIRSVLDDLLTAASREGWAEFGDGSEEAEVVSVSGRLRTLGAESVAVLPIRTVRSRLGILLVGRVGPGGWSAREQGTLGLLAEQLAVGIENLRLQERLENHSRELNRTVEERTRELQRSRERLAALLNVNNAVVSNLEREPLFRGIADALRAVVEFDRASLMLLEADGEHLTVTTLTGPGEGSEPKPGGSLLRRDRSMAGQVLARGRPVVRRDLRQRTPVEEEKVLLKAGIRSYVSVPLVARDRSLGVLAVGSRQAERYDQGDAAFLMQVGRQVALGVDNMLAYERAEELRRQVELENRYLRDEIETTRSLGEIVGQSPAIQQTVEKLAQVAPTDVTVLVQGESGTGKELVAREIHRRSDRCEAPMVKVNCAAIPRELYESEFFGHVKGAFSGAVRDRSGRFAAADGGTLFLDEVGELPLDLQSKLLRVLQDGTYQRVGEDEERRVDVRVIAASNRVLEDEVREGRFREDLFYRLNVFPIRVPPLRERKEDIPLLAQNFLHEFQAEGNDEDRIELSRADVARLEQYDWPGNVRELRSTVQRALITAQGGRLHFELPDRHAGSRSRKALSTDPRDGEEEGVPEILTEDEMEERVKRNIEAALQACDGKVYGDQGAARLLGIPPTTLASRIKKFGLDD